MRHIYREDTAIIKKLHAYFVRQRETYLSGGDSGRAIAECPSTDHLAEIVNGAFWASLHKEEGHVTTLSLAYVSAEHAKNPFEFVEPLSLDPKVLAKIAPAVERPGIHLGVWPDELGTLRVWGTTRTLPLLSFVLEVAGPGVLVVKHRRKGRDTKFVNVAVLAGDDTKFVSDAGGASLDCKSMLVSLLGGPGGANGRLWPDPTNV